MHVIGLLQVTFNILCICEKKPHTWSNNLWPRHVHTIDSNLIPRLRHGIRLESLVLGRAILFVFFFNFRENEISLVFKYCILWCWFQKYLSFWIWTPFKATWILDFILQREIGKNTKGNLKILVFFILPKNL